jgi:hypothetical protein
MKVQFNQRVSTPRLLSFLFLFASLWAFTSEAKPKRALTEKDVGA